MARTSLELRRDGLERDHLVGRIVAIDANGRALVHFPGVESAVVARSALSETVRVGERPEDVVGAPVLLVLEDGNPSLPIIVGLIRERLRPEPVLPELKLDLGRDRDVLIDGRRLVLDAQQEIVLCCGKSTIVLKRDGKVLIRGAHLVSRSSGPNRIKGGSISLN